MGTVASSFAQLFPPRPKFTASEIPNLTGKVIIVTGGYAGIGKETVKTLLSHNATVYIAARDPAKAAMAIEELLSLTGKSPIFLKLDLADLKSIKAAVEEFTSKDQELHVLINNAGVMAPPVEQTTKDGYDLQFGTNVLGHFYFTYLLMPTLISTAKSSPPGTVRVVNVSSLAAFRGHLDFNTFKDGPSRRKYRSLALYEQSKLGNVVITAELVRRYGKEGIIFTSLNPGSVKTELQRHFSPIVVAILNLFLFDVSYGALTQLWAATSKEGAELNGRFLIPWARIGPYPKESQDEQSGGELWKWCEEQVKDL